MESKEFKIKPEIMSKMQSGRKLSTEESIEMINMSIEMQPDSYAGYLARAQIYLYTLNQPENAIEDLSIAIRLKPDDHYLYSGRAYAFTEVKEYEKALDDYTKAIMLSPENGQYYLLRARVRAFISIRDILSYNSSKKFYFDETNDEVLSDLIKGITFDAKTASEFSKILSVDLFDILTDKILSSHDLKEEFKIFLMIGLFRNQLFLTDNFNKEKCVKDIEKVIESLRSYNETYGNESFSVKILNYLRSLISGSEFDFNREFGYIQQDYAYGYKVNPIDSLIIDFRGDIKKNAEFHYSLNKLLYILRDKDILNKSKFCIECYNLLTVYSFLRIKLKENEVLDLKKENEIAEENERSVLETGLIPKLSKFFAPTNFNGDIDKSIYRLLHTNYKREENLEHIQGIKEYFDTFSAQLSEKNRILLDEFIENYKIKLPDGSNVDKIKKEFYFYPKDLEKLEIGNEIVSYAENSVINEIWNKIISETKDHCNFDKCKFHEPVIGDFEIKYIIEQHEEFPFNKFIQAGKTIRIYQKIKYYGNIIIYSETKKFDVLNEKIQESGEDVKGTRIEMILKKIPTVKENGSKR